MAMLALVIDVGLLAVQKRFDQNAADAAALGIARSMAGQVVVQPNGQIAFSVSGTALQNTLTQLATANAHAGLASRTTRLPMLEFSADNGGSWCIALPTQAGGCATIPPAPAFSTPYLVRVTISSTTSGFFTGLMGSGATSGCPATGGTGYTTCALAVASIAGSTALPPGMQVIPASIPECEVSAGQVWQVFELWGSNSSPCHDTGGWKNLIDFTPYQESLDPNVYRPFHGTGYEPDDVYTGSGKRKDLTYWIANGFGGEVTIDNWLLTGKSGTAEGCISRGFYGGGGACDVNGRNDDWTETYFFDNTELGKITPVPFGWFDCSSATPRDPIVSPGMRVGCRDVAIIAWHTPQVLQGQTWVNITNGQPDRVRVKSFYVFRFYCGWSSDNQRCDQRPPSAALPGCPSAGSGICGRLKSTVAVTSCPMCSQGPSVTINAVRLRD